MTARPRIDRGSGPRWLFLLLVAGFAARAFAVDAPEPVTRVTLELATPGAEIARLEGSVAFLRAERPGVADTPIIVPVEGRRTIHVDLPAGARWQVSTSIPNFWSRRESLSANEPGEVVRRIRLWPLAQVKATVRLAEGEERPKELSLATVELPVRVKRRDLPVARVACSLGEHGAMRCDFPAATVDLVLAAPGFVPAYRWHVELTPGKIADLGLVELRRGASVVGWAEAEGGALDSATCRATLTPAVAGGGDPGTAVRLQAARLTSRVEKDGFFQLRGVAPGSYRLEVAQPGYVPARVAPLTVRAGGETFVNRPLILRRPLDLHFTIVPPLDWLNARWGVRLARHADLGSSLSYGPEIRREADERGMVAFADQAEGRFMVTVTDSLGNRLLAVPDLMVAGGEDARQTLRVDLITVRGTVRLGRDPLAATLWFGGMHGGASIKMESDADGKFHGVLPRGGSWPVDIRGEEPKLAAQRSVTVEAREGAATVAIDLPNTRVFGRVVDAEGRRVSAASVYLQSGSAVLPLQSGAEGDFDARAFPEGMVDLSAEQGHRASDRLGLFVPPDEPIGPVELRLRDLKSWSGTVVTPEGPARGANVMILPWRPPLTPGDSVTTDLEGGFTAHLPQETGTVLVVVAAPAASLQAFEVASERAAVLAVSEEGGDVEIELGRTEEELEAQGLALAISQNGLLLPPAVVANWSVSHGAGVAALFGASRRAPDLAPGAYQACLVETARLRELRRTSALDEQGGRCVSGILTSGGTLELDLRDRGAPGTKPDGR